MQVLAAIFFIMVGWECSYADLGDVELLYAKQIAWTASNLENAQVSKYFHSSFQSLLKDSAKLKQLNSPEGQQILEQGKNLLRVLKLKAELEHCLLNEAAAQSVLHSISRAMSLNVLKPNSCVDFKSANGQIGRFSQTLDNSFKDKVKSKILATARSQLEHTKKYWLEAQKQNAVDIAAELSDREWDMKERPPQSGAELLLYTKAIQNRKNKELVGLADVKNAFLEVQTELKNHENYLNTVASQESGKALESLLVTNPAASAEFLIENPESLNLICKILQDYDTQIKHKESLNSALFWGGLVIGGTLLVTGIGAGVGAVILSGTTAAGTLTAVAAGSALAGTMNAAGETIYSSSKTFNLYSEAQNIRSAAFSEGFPRGSLSKAEQTKAQAYSELATAGFSAVSLIPFGSGFKAIKSVAQASRIGGASKVLSEGAKIESEVVGAIALALKEVSSDDAVLKTLEKAQKTVSSEEMTTFLGYFSDLPASERTKVLALIKNHPDKVPEALRNSAKKEVCQ